jgi:hypothetical protein
MCLSVMKAIGMRKALMPFAFVKSINFFLSLFLRTADLLQASKNVRIDQMSSEENLNPRKSFEMTLICNSEWIVAEHVASHIAKQIVCKDGTIVVWCQEFKSN